MLFCPGFLLNLVKSAGLYRMTGLMVWRLQNGSVLDQFYNVPWPIQRAAMFSQLYFANIVLSL